MSQLIEYLFYRFYYSKDGNHSKEPIWAVGGVSMLLMLNIFSIFDALYIITDNDKFDLSKWVVSFIGIAIVIFNYFMLVYGGRAEIISKKFTNESPNKRLFRGLIMYAYIITTIILMFYFGQLIRRMQN